MIKYAITKYVIKYAIKNDYAIRNDVIKYAIKNDYAITNDVINKKINDNFVFPNTPAQLTLNDTCLLKKRQYYGLFPQLRYSLTNSTLTKLQVKLVVSICFGWKLCYVGDRNQTDCLRKTWKICTTLLSTWTTTSSKFHIITKLANKMLSERISCTF